MSLLYRVVFSYECTSTHHKLVLDALRHLRRDDAPHWMALFLRHFDACLQGAEAPDGRFRDYRNHVLLVDDDNWGGAPEQAGEWYAKLVDELRAERWRRAAYAAGVLSHYYTDLWQPLHTAQSAAGCCVHQAVEWNVRRCYGELQNILEEDLGGYPDFDVPEGDDWLAKMLHAAATQANTHHATILEHFDLALGSRRPRQGMDQELKDCMALLIGHAAVGFSRILERAIDEAGAEPPRFQSTAIGLLALLFAPIAGMVWLWKNWREAASVRRVYREYQRRGRVDAKLSREVRALRRLYADEVRRVSEEELAEVEVEPIGEQFRDGAAPRDRSHQAVTKIVRPLSKIEGTQAAANSESRAAAAGLHYRLDLQQDVAQAPSISRREAKRLKKIGVRTIAELLNADPDDLVEELALSYVDADTIVRWQRESQLLYRTPHLRASDARLLVACDIVEPEDLTSLDADELFALLEAFSETEEGQQLLGDADGPELADVQRWRKWAENARDWPAAA